MSETKMCCNCLHCARWRRKDGIETHCDLTDKYLGYLKVMDEDNDCKHWEKETKWDEQRKHDEEIRAEVIDEFKQKSYDIIEEIILHSNLEINQQLTIYAQIMVRIDRLEEQLKEQKNEKN